MPPRAHRCWLHQLALGACCLLLTNGAAALGQLLEFKSTELRGRIDRVSIENVWTIGDDNGNGTLDENETFGPRIDMERVFLDDPDQGPVRQGHQRPESAHFSGAHVMQVLKFDGDPELTLFATAETLEVGYGARFFTGLQDFRYLGLGVAEGFGVNSSIENQAIGPQVSLSWTLRHGPWQMKAETAAALTYMNIDGDQSARFGGYLIPGQYNRPLYLSPTSFEHHLNEWDIAPAVEATLLASYDITPTTTCFARGDAIQFGNLRDAEDAIVYHLPRMGLRDPGGHDVTVTAISVGVEMRR